MSLPDPIERAEAAAERAFDDLSLPDGQFKCYQCGCSFDPDDEGGTLSPDPYAMPVCGECLENAMNEYRENRLNGEGGPI